MSTNKKYQISVVIPDSTLPAYKQGKEIKQEGGLLTLDETTAAINELSTKEVHWVELKNGVVLSFSTEQQKIMHWIAHPTQETS